MDESPLTLNYYRSRNFKKWVNAVISNNKIDAIVVFSSAMAQFVEIDWYSRTLVDFVDVDSQKWSEYADKKNFPISWLYRRESKLLLKYERFLASKVKHSFFVTEKERNIFSNFAPDSVLKTSSLNNGVDSDFFTQNDSFSSPFIEDENECTQIVFTGAMDYWPNVDAVTWFFENVFKLLIQKKSNFRFYIVGRNPTQAVLNLNSKFVVVTGTVADVRPYLQFAKIVVAPLRIARGVQNKILEAMSMQKPVIASVECVRAIDSTDGVDILSAETPMDFINKIDFLIADDQRAEMIGRAARINVEDKYSWHSHLKKIDQYLEFDKIEDVL